MSDTIVNQITSLIVKGIAKGATAIAQATVRTIDVDHNALDVAINGALPLPTDAATATLQTTGNTSAATTATNTGTLAGAVSAPDAALPAAAMQIGGVASTAAPSPVTSGRGVRAWLTLVGAQMMGVLGVNGSAIASASNGVPVVAQTSSTWDVASNLTRALGYLTGINGTAIASITNGVPILFSVMTSTVGATIPIVGVAIKAGPGILGFGWIKNSTGGTVYWQVHNSLATPAAGAVPHEGSSSSITNGTLVKVYPGNGMPGLHCDVGIWLVLSTTQYTYTAVASATSTYDLNYY